MTPNSAHPERPLTSFATGLTCIALLAAVVPAVSLMGGEVASLPGEAEHGARASGMVGSTVPTSADEDGEGSNDRSSLEVGAEDTDSPGSPSGMPPSASPVERLPAVPRGSVPILYYHRVQAPPRGFARWSPRRRRDFLRYDVLPTALQAQLDWLAGNGYTTILPRDLAMHWDKRKSLPKKPVILTFDDGFHDWASVVLPLLMARHMVAEFYLTIDAIRSGSITWREVRTLARHGNGIGAHDVHHVQLARLGRGRPAASPAVMWAEVSRARRIIADHIGVPPDSLAYVGGGFDVTLARLVRKAGYTTARSIIRGIVQTPRRRFELRVVRIGSRDDVADVLRGSLLPGLPTFVARMHGVSD